MAVADRLPGRAAAFRRRLERQGPTFVKIGQFLALRPDLVPEDYSRELMALLDRVPAFAWEEARHTIEEELGEPVQRLFAHVNPDPLASGSLAQTHLARLPDGTEVVVKVQRPGVRDQIRRDLKRAEAFARILHATGLSLVISPREVLGEVRWWLEQELDMTNELRNIQRLRKLADGSPFERIPRPYASLSSKRVLTSEFLHGVPLSEVLASLRAGSETELERVRKLGIERETLAGGVLSAVLRQIFEYKFFHADVHPGNLMVLPDGRVGFMDFGLCEELDDRVREGQLEGLSAAYSGDVDQMFDALVKILEPGDETDMAAFQRDFAAHTRNWLARIQSVEAVDGGDPDGPALLGAAEDGESGSAQALESPIGQWMLGTVKTAREHQMRLPPRVLSLYRTLLTAETVARQIGSNVDLRSVGHNFFVRMRIQDELRSVSPMQWQSTALSMLTLYRDGPRQLSRVLADLSDGRLNVNVTMAESPGTAAARRRRTRLLTVSVASVALAVVVASAPAALGGALDTFMWFGLAGLWVLAIIGYRRLG